MFWFCLGVLLTVAYFGFWTFAIAWSDEDDEGAMARYEAQRRQFEEWFE